MGAPALCRRSAIESCIAEIPRPFVVVVVIEPVIDVVPIRDYDNDNDNDQRGSRNICAVALVRRPAVVAVEAISPRSVSTANCASNAGCSPALCP